MIKNAVKGSFLAKIGLPFMMGVVLRVKKTMDPRLYNGAMFVGLNGLSVKATAAPTRWVFRLPFPTRPIWSDRTLFRPFAAKLKN